MIWADNSRKWGVCDTFLVPLCTSFIMSMVMYEMCHTMTLWYVMCEELNPYSDTKNKAFVLMVRETMV